MTYAAAEARQELLDAVAEVAGDLAFALACLGEAYEALDDQNADKLEQALFRPAQTAYGRVKRTHAGFAERHGLPGRTFEQPSAGVSSNRATGFVEKAMEAIGGADTALAELQDSMRPVEVGDAELRADLAAVRERVAGLPEQARQFLRRLGR